MAARPKPPLPSNRLSKGTRGVAADGRTKAHEELALSISRRPWPECVPQKIKALTRPFSAAIRVLTIHDSRFGRIQAELTKRQTLLDPFLNPHELFV